MFVLSRSSTVGSRARTSGGEARHGQTPPTSPPGWCALCDKLAEACSRARMAWAFQRAGEVWFFANARNIASIELHRRFGFEEITRHFSFLRLTFDGGEGILFRSRLGALPRVGVKPRGLQGRLRARVLVLIARAGQPD